MSQVPTHQLTIDEVHAGRDWSALERDLIAECVLGRPAFLPDKAELPEDISDPDRRVRPALIRYLILGGCDRGARPHPNGVEIIGGWIDGVLDLSYCRTHLKLNLSRCLLPQGGRIRDARLGTLFLPGCRVEGKLDLQRLRTDGAVHMRDRFHCTGAVDLGAARIGGQLACTDGTFAATKEPALDCDAAQIGTSVFLSDGFEATAEVSFAGTRISGPLICNGGRFLATGRRALNCDGAEIGADVFLSDGFEAMAEVSFFRTRIGGLLFCAGGKLRAKEGLTLNCNTAEIGADVFLTSGFEADGMVSFIRAQIAGNLLIAARDAYAAPTLGAGIGLAEARIGGGLFWRGVQGLRGLVDLTEMRVGSLRDDWAAWEGVQTLMLERFTYDRVEESMSVAQRLDWLGKAAESMRIDPEIGPSFDPQPHVQLATVLRAQGNRDGASRVLVDREKRQRRAAWQRSHDRLDGTWKEAFRSLKGDGAALASWLFGVFFGYGHRPGRAVWTALTLILVAAWLNGAAYKAGQFAPNSPVIMTSQAWLDAVEKSEVPGAQPALMIWQQTYDERDYETFNRWIYGLDLVLPLDALGQEDAWRATTGQTLGNLAFYSRWFFQMAGILLAAVGAAVLTGLVGRRD